MQQEGTSLIKNRLLEEFDTTSDFSILNLSIKIQQFLVFYYEFFTKTSALHFYYDSRNQSLSVQGSSSAIAQSYKHMKILLERYTASEFSFIISNGKILNFIVGTLAQKPNIKYFDSQKVKELNAFENIHIEIEKKKTFMIGPKDQVAALIEQFIIAIGVGIIGAISLVKKISDNKKNKQKESENKFIQTLNKKQSTSEQTIENIFCNLACSSAIDKKQKENFNSLQPNQLLIEIDKQLASFALACQFMLQKIVLTLSFSYPTVSIMKTDFKLGCFIFIAKFESLAQRSMITQRIQTIISEFSFIFFSTEKYIKDFTQIKNNTKQHKIFLSDECTRAVLISKKDSTWSKIDSATDYIEEMRKKNTDNSKRDSVISSSSSAIKMEKKDLKFPFLIGEEVNEFIETTSQKVEDVFVSYNRQSNIHERSHFTLIYKDICCVIKGPQKLIESFTAEIKVKIQKSQEAKKILSREISQNTHKKMSLNLESLRALSEKYQCKICTNNLIVPEFKLNQISNKGQIIGLKETLCDIFVDKSNSYLLFNSQKDFQNFGRSVRTKNIIAGKFYSQSVICEQKFPNSNFSLAIYSFLQNLNRLDKGQKKPRIFLFSQVKVLKSMIWDLGSYFRQFPTLIITIFMVMNENCQTTKQIPDHYKRWFTVINGNYTYYSDLGNKVINKAIEDGSSKIILNSDHISYTRSTHEVDLINKKLSHLRYQIECQYRDTGNWIQYDLNGITHRMADCRFQEIKKAQKYKYDYIEISLSLFEINLVNMTQKNLWNNYQRQVLSENISLAQKDLSLEKDVPFSTIQIVGSQENPPQKCAEAIIFQFTKYTEQKVKLSPGLNPVTIQTLKNLCRSSNIQINMKLANQFVLKYENGNTEIKTILKYVEMINSSEMLVPFPVEWEHRPVQKYQQVEVSNQSQQFKTIQKTFPYTIHSMKRIQNYNAFTRYFQQKRLLQKINRSKNIKQLELFHGTRSIDPSTITSDNEITFNTNYSVDSNFMGRGTYFALNPKYSHDYRYHVNRNRGLMLLCLVLVGDSQICPKLKENYLNTNFKDPSKSIRYESMTAFYGGSQIYTIYKNHRAYPKYKIEYDF